METKLFRTAEMRRTSLTRKVQEKILAIDPAFQAISAAEYFDNYDQPCPIRVEVTTKDLKVVSVVLRETRHGDVRTEVQVMRALKECDLPVPTILAEPFLNEDGKYAAIYSLLRGENLQKLSLRSERDLQAAKDLLLQAVVRLIEATEYLRTNEVSKILPSIRLMDELKAIETRDNPWLGEAAYQDALRTLQKALPHLSTSLVFSNGDWQPGNFLSQDGEITGFLDFESALFQDPLMGFVKYPIYDLYPLARTDLIQMFLDAQGFSEEDFDHRLALGCLKTLKNEIPVSGGDRGTQDYRNRVLALLKKACASS